jgi:adenine-specific DNA-methyltransferase
LSNIQQGKIPITYWANEEYEEKVELGNVSWPYGESGHTAAAYKEIASRVGGTHGFVTGKPLKLFKKIIQLWCPNNGLVLDPFAGSGTTGEAVLELNKENNINRSFILMEQGNPENDDNYCRTLLWKRLQAIISGKWADKKKHEPLNGDFVFYSLNKTIDNQTLLEMKKDDLIDAILASQMENNWTRIENYQYLFAKNVENEGIFLIWNGNSQSQLTQEIYYKIVQESQKANLSTENYIIYARLCSFRTENTEFKNIPSEILSSFRISD